MRNIWTIAKREFSLYFSTPIAYFVAFFIMLVLGFLFYNNLLGAMMQQIAPGVEIVINPFLTLLLFGIPALTMRLIADEERMGTIELLLTAPVRDAELVVGKWLGGFFFLLVLVVITLIFPFFLNLITNPGIDQGPLVSGYLGIILICASLVAIGVAVSAFFSNQIAAYFVTLGVLLALWLIGTPARVAGLTGNNLLTYLDFSEHFYPTLYQGIINLADVVYYLSVTALALFIGTIAVEVRRWR